MQKMYGWNYANEPQKKEGGSIGGIITGQLLEKMTVKTPVQMRFKSQISRHWWGEDNWKQRTELSFPVCVCLLKS